MNHVKYIQINLDESGGDVKEEIQSGSEGNHQQDDSTAMKSEKGIEINEEEEEIKETKAPTKVAGESCWKNKLVESDARSVLFNTFDYNLIYISWTYNNNVTLLR